MQRDLARSRLEFELEARRYAPRRAELPKDMSSHASTTPSDAGGLTPPSSFDEGVAEQSEAQLADVLDSMIEAFYGYDREWRFVRLNRAARARVRAANLEAADVLGRTLWSVFPQTLGTEYERLFRRAMEERIPAQFTERDLVHDRWLDVRVVPTAEGVAAYVQDVTERIVADQQRNLLLRVGELVGESLDAARTLDAIARAAVPEFADYTIVDVLDADGSVRRVTGAHADAAQMPALARLLAVPPRLDSASFVAGVLRTGQPVLAPVMDAATIDALSDDPVVRDIVRALAPRSCIVVPLVVNGATLGSLMLARSRTRAFTEEDLSVAQEIGRRAASALEHARLFEAERVAREAAEREAHRVARLNQLTVAVAAADTRAGVTRVILEQAVSAARAVAGGVLELSPDGSHLVLLDVTGYGRAEVRESFGRTSVERALPARDVVRTREAVYLESRDRWIAAGYELPSPNPALRAGIAWAALPLRVDDRLLGVLALAFDDARRIAPAEREYLEAFARSCAQALERATLYDAERVARTRAERLQALTASLAGAVTAAEVTHAALVEASRVVGSTTGALCLLDADGEMFHLTPGPGMPEDVAAAWRVFPVGGDSRAGDAVRTREPCYSRTRAEFAGTSPGLAAAAERLGIEANAAVPLLVGDRVLGALAFTFGEPREFAPEDDAFLRAVASQCAQALERARLFESERHAREIAEAASRAKGEFLAVMSHELRTPLNAIGGYVELLEMGIRGPVTPAQREDLERIQKSQRHLLLLINEVLNYARLESGAVTYDLRQTVVADVVAATVPLVEPQRAARMLTLSIELPDSPEPPRVIADADKLQQILLNLLSNAVKFTPAGGRVTVRCAPVDGDDTRLAIEVRDTGVGIPFDRHDAVFEPFVQVGRALNNPGEGTGLGLAISRDLARGMGGEPTVESAVGLGSVFRLVLARA